MTCSAVMGSWGTWPSGVRSQVLLLSGAIAKPPASLPAASHRNNASLAARAVLLWWRGPFCSRFREAASGYSPLALRGGQAGVKQETREMARIGLAV